MKRILITSILAVLTFAAASAQQHLVRLTRYQGRPITGVSASSGFDVYLVQSTETKVVAEISEELEPYLTLTLGTDGIVHAGLDMRNSGLRGLSIRNSTLKVTVFLPALTSLRGSGGSDFYADDTFQAPHMKIVMSGGSDLESFRVEADVLEIDASGGSDIVLSGRAGELELNVSGGADAELNVSCTSARVNVSGGADAELRGEAQQATFTVSGGADLDAAGFAVNKLAVNTSGAGSASVWAVDELKATASGAGHVRYRGRPARLDNRSSSAGRISKAD